MINMTMLMVVDERRIMFPFSCISSSVALRSKRTLPGSHVLLLWILVVGLFFWRSRGSAEKPISVLVGYAFLSVATTSRHCQYAMRFAAAAQCRLSGQLTTLSEMRIDMFFDSIRHNKLFIVNMCVRFYRRNYCSK